ncbi:MAG: Formamidopyrimidine-DNA glycosylase (Fapy-DNA glycosylase) [uncultured bacterium]|nr:MAG: Formamidopyrimidine-DNA glycosylase (Fapy-DNA glycosylase) [uncultured bacterium]
MPELPEVFTITTDLNKHISGYTIESAKIVGGYKVIPGPKAFTQGLSGQLITGVERIAKNIIINLASGNSLLVHLAMTGQVLLKESTAKEPRWTRVILKLTKGTDTKTLFLTDMRMFGKIALINPTTLTKLRAKYGPDPIQSIEPNPVEEFYLKVMQKKTSIKNALLDQTIISGVGNIYATDALFLAGIHPLTPTTKLTQNTLSKLFDKIKLILQEGIKHRGSTLSDKMYVDIFGKEGSHQNFFRIYGKTNCPNCNAKVQFSKINGRGTYFCLNCQPIGDQLGLF